MIEGKLMRFIDAIKPYARVEEHINQHNFCSACPSFQKGVLELT
jgi:hypothetical protein